MTDSFGQCLMRDDESFYANWHVKGSPEEIADSQYLVFTTYLPILCIVAVAAVVLLFKAPSPHVRQIAYYAFLIWFSFWLNCVWQTIHCILLVDSMSALSRLLEIMFYLVFAVQNMVSAAVTVKRFQVLEEGFLGEVPYSKLLRRLLYFTAAASLVLASILGNQFMRDHLVYLIIGYIVTFVVLCSWMCIVVCGVLVWRHVEKLANVGVACFSRASRDRRDLLMQARAQFSGIFLCQLTSFLNLLMQTIFQETSSEDSLQMHGRSTEMSTVKAYYWLRAFPYVCDLLANLFFAVVISGCLWGAWPSIRKADQLEEERKKRHVKKRWKADKNEDWQAKIYELANRSITLEAIFEFYHGLGHDYMEHYDPDQHTEEDVLRRAIIPLTAQERCSYATKMKQEGTGPSRPQVMVTHAWTNNFKDLIAAICAHAIGEEEYCMVGRLLVSDPDGLRKWIAACGNFSITYWICLFSVNPHASFCGANPNGRQDPVTHETHPTCPCGLQKQFNHTPPLYEDRSIGCEMNKFHLMLQYLSAEDSQLELVCAVDYDFDVFTRAWCISEIAEAHTGGVIRLQLKIHSSDRLEEQKHRLQGMKVENLQATREEDKKEILDAIPDKAKFNDHLQCMFFQKLFPAWNKIDEAEQINRIGRLARWGEKASKVRRESPRPSRLSSSILLTQEGSETPRSNSDDVAFAPVIPVLPGSMP
eukprot:TRINITY_DN11268_c0_g1_i4.p1 TRINITY_DN11268_c0_g1~~TRINITY_DN11268_c0_g1_i4.p1  ORF type:complete len:816 (-),score=84.41 TRINITY_DN11268_c0_g1_i4:104-2209(-)